jgi:UDP-2-acetamido-2-deoxy-ribo-hexuluronate aminotransferase
VQAVAARYDAALASLPGLHLPVRDPRSSHVFHQYTVRVEGEGQRDALQAHLKAHGIPSAVYYPLPVHAQPAYAYLGYQLGQFPVAERLCKQVLSLPVHPGMTAAQVDYVVTHLSYFGT